MIGIPNFMGIRFSGGPLGPQYLLYMVGRNHRGQLGVGNTTNRSFLTKVGTNTNWASVEGGAYHTLAVRTNGTLWAWGYNNKGQLGLRDTTNRSVPIQIGTDNDWASVSAGNYHTLARKTNGTLWAWGDNDRGRLGLGDQTNRSFPVQVGTGTDWASVSAGGVFTVAIKTNGTLWTWGLNVHGQLGLGDTLERLSPIQVGTDANWASVSAGSNQILAVKTTGTLWAWGYNGRGQLGLRDTTNRSVPFQVGTGTDWASVSASVGGSTFARKTNGTLWAWGVNDFGVQGRGNTTNTSSPIQVGSDSNWAKVSANMYNTFGIKYPSGITGVTFGPLYAWGRNNHGQLGIATIYRTSPTQIGSGPTGDWGIPCAAGQASLVLKGNTGSSGLYLWVWGSNTSLFSKWPLPTGSAGTFQSPFAVDSNKNWVNVDTGYGHGLARKTNNTIWGWGRNRYGILGLGDTTGRYTATQIGANTDWADIKAGGFHSVALKTDGTLWVWGENYPSSRQLGGATTSNSVSSPIQLGSDTDWAKISTGYYHTLAIKTNGTLWGWGGNTYGELGIGNITTPTSPVQVGSGTTGPWVNIATGRRFSLGVQNNGTLWAWGNNIYGNLGIGTASGARQSVPIQVGAMTNWDKVECGNNHSVAIKSDKTLWTWGLGLSGQLGNGTLTNTSSPIQIGSDTWLYASASKFHTLGTRTDGTLWGWGGRNSGVLAMDDGTSYSSPIQVGSLTGWSISSISNTSTTRDAMGIVLRKS